MLEQIVLNEINPSSATLNHKIKRWGHRMGAMPTTDTCHQRYTRAKKIHSIS
jgi:hypothetical protein